MIAAASELLQLAERVERAEGPDREIDGAIDRLFYDRPKHLDYDASEQALWRIENGYSGLLVRADGFARGSFCALRYTASLDAAMMLVPERWTRDIRDADNGDCLVELWLEGPPDISVFSRAKTWPMALAAAALRAQAGRAG